MRVDEFIKREKQRLDRFRKHWARQRRGYSISETRAREIEYPSVLPENEWYEEYLGYIDTIEAYEEDSCS